MKVLEYLYDPHTHTAEVSHCGRLGASELVERYRGQGFAGIAVTDHLHEEYIASLDCRDDWQACVSAYLKGYRRAIDSAQKVGMDVLLGAEIRFPENDRDFLVYGIDEAFLRRNPYLYRLGCRTFFERFSGETLIIQAHPFRDFDEADGDIPTGCVHGLEVLNRSPRHDSQNERAAKLLDQHPHLVALCGSDTHRPGDEARAAMVFRRRISDSSLFKDAVKSGLYEIRQLGGA